MKKLVNVSVLFGVVALLMLLAAGSAGATEAEPEGTAIRINFEIAGHAAKKGHYSVQLLGGGEVASWYALDGWEDSGWISNIDAGTGTKYVQVLYYPGPDTEPTVMRILNHAPGTPYGWISEGIAHALEVAWPDMEILADTSATEGAAASGGTSGSSGIVHSVVKAPIVPDGNVAGAPTDLVINLNGSMHPLVSGRILRQGDQIRVTFPSEFINEGNLEGKTVFTSGCTPADFQCNSGVLLQGWPQHPKLPKSPSAGDVPVFYRTILDGNTLIYEALQEVGDATPAPGPGIKGMHLMAVGFTNPGAGVYDIEVAAQTGPDGAWEYGTGRVQILPEVRPSINVTSAFNASTPNTIYQTAALSGETPLAHDFYLWDYNSEPFLGVEIEMLDGEHGLLKQDSKVVGDIHITSPTDATGQFVAGGPSTPVNAFLFGVPAGRLTAQFTAGSTPGDYAVTYSLRGGNSVTMYVTVN